MDWKNCRKNVPVLANMNFTNGTFDQVEMSGFLNFTEELNNDLELRYDAFRCSFDMKTCDRYPLGTQSSFCEKIAVENAFYSDIINSIEPKFKCPLKTGIYKINKKSFIFPSFYSYIPLNGYVWVLTFKFVDTKNKSLKACFTIQMKFVLKRLRN